jgi:hypothetical protein
MTLQRTKRTPEEWLMFQMASLKVLIGQNISTGLPTYEMAWTLMEDGRSSTKQI